MLQVEQPALVRVPRPGMRLIQSRQFLMGSDIHYPEEAPARRVMVDSFWIDETPVTNSQFEEFVRDTGYVTLAERAPDPDDYPGILPSMIRPGSLLFRQPDRPVDAGEITVAEAEFLEPRTAPCVVAARAERADVEAI